ncbi:hypothetical protein GCM10011581_02850 [Saccharopolyspora subtropica]|uniref:ESAT-6-like protein n=1 Tax=Saccharopolyspora thermophila TaxID=89367 RepID=A0A917N6J5_9PSEU|nr:WXG100 family type VII secretion target [Saccharopolyspora subtropica]GGI69275.1 hypothetical protein GCM10011581_02850 [Saccharopolyspora subtropica]
MADQIQYRYAEIANSVADMQKASKSIEEEVNNLTNQTRQLLTTFDGQTRASYETLSGKIQADLSQMNTMLINIQSRLGISADDMNAEDARQAANFA